MTHGDPDQRWRRVLLRGGPFAAALGLAAVCVYFVVAAIASRWDEVGNDLRAARPAWLAVATLSATAGMASIAVVWGRVLRSVGSAVPTGRVMRWYFLGEIGKYVPGGVWPVLGRGELARRGGVSQHDAYVSVMVSLLLLYTAAAGWTLVCATATGGRPAVAVAVCAVAVTAMGVLLHPGVSNRLTAMARRVIGRTPEFTLPPWGTSARLALTYLPTWCCIGLATAAVAHALGYHFSLARVLLATSASWAAGFVVVPVPGGAGIREAVFAVCSGLGEGRGAIVAVASRLIFIAVDVVGFAAAALATRRSSPSVPEGPPSVEPIPIQ